MKTLYSVQALRAVAAVLVVIEHSFNSVDHGLGPGVRDQMKTFGSAGVLTFFVISGFIIYYTSHRHLGEPEYIGTFLRRRLIRIYPVYWILGLANIPLLAGMGLFEDRTPGDVAKALALLPSNSSTLIFIGWTLSYEVFFYLVFCMLLPLPRRFVLPALTVLFLVLIKLGVFMPLDGPAEALFEVATSSLLLAFLFGAWIAFALLEGTRLPVWAGVPLTALGIAGLAANWLVPRDLLPTVLTFGVPGAIVVFGVLQLEQQRQGERLFAWFRRLGDASYSIYLCHAVIVPLAAFALLEGVALGLPATIAWTGALVTLSVCASLVFSEAVEQPMIRTLNRRLSGRAPGAQDRSRSAGHEGSAGGRRTPL